MSRLLPVAKLEGKTDAGRDGAPGVGIRTCNVGRVGPEHVEMLEPVGRASADVPVVVPHHAVVLNQTFGGINFPWKRKSRACYGRPETQSSMRVLPGDKAVCREFPGHLIRSFPPRVAAIVGNIDRPFDNSLGVTTLHRQSFRQSVQSSPHVR